MQRLDTLALFHSAEGFRGLWFHMTVRIKIDELLARGKSSILPLFFSTALNTSASCFDGSAFYFRRQSNIATIRSQDLTFLSLLF